MGVTVDDEINLHIFENYHSPFLTPPVLKCNDPQDHNRWPHVHSDNMMKPCPVHNSQERERLEARYEWKRWEAYRKAYAEAEPGPYGDGDRAVAMRSMLQCVTEDNPPYAPSVVVRQQARTAASKVSDALVVGLLLAFIFIGILFI